MIDPRFEIVFLTSSPQFYKNAKDGGKSSPWAKCQRLRKIERGKSEKCLLKAPETAKVKKLNHFNSHFINQQCISNKKYVLSSYYVKDTILMTIKNEKEQVFFPLKVFAVFDRENKAPLLIHTVTTGLGKNSVWDKQQGVSKKQAIGTQMEKERNKLIQKTYYLYTQTHFLTSYPSINISTQWQYSATVLQDVTVGETE